MCALLCSQYYYFPYQISVSTENIEMKNWKFHWIYKGKFCLRYTQFSFLKLGGKKSGRRCFRRKFLDKFLIYFLLNFSVTFFPLLYMMGSVVHTCFGETCFHVNLFFMYIMYRVSYYDIDLFFEDFRTFFRAHSKTNIVSGHLRLF